MASSTQTPTLPPASSAALAAAGPPGAAPTPATAAAAATSSALPAGASSAASAGWSTLTNMCGPEVKAASSVGLSTCAVAQAHCGTRLHPLPLRLECI